MRVVVDSHAVVWYLKGSPQLSPAARDVLTGAEVDAGIVVSVATLIDLWYVTQTTRALGTAELGRLRDRLLRSPAVDLHPVDVDVADAYFRIDRGLLRDPWDRLIVATAMALALPLVTRGHQLVTRGHQRSQPGRDAVVKQVQREHRVKRLSNLLFRDDHGCVVRANQRPSL